jgi:hypothetical protein
MDDVITASLNFSSERPKECRFVSERDGAVNDAYACRSSRCLQFASLWKRAVESPVKGLTGRLRVMQRTEQPTLDRSTMEVFDNLEHSHEDLKILAVNSARKR